MCYALFRSLDSNVLFTLFSFLFSRIISVGKSQQFHIGENQVNLVKYLVHILRLLILFCGLVLKALSNSKQQSSCPKLKFSSLTYTFVY